MAFDAGCGVKLIQCTREVSPLSEWVRWRLFQERVSRPVKELFSSDQHAKSFKDANRPIPLPHKASAKREHQEGSWNFVVELVEIRLQHRSQWTKRNRTFSCNGGTEKWFSPRKVQRSPWNFQNVSNLSRPFKNSSQIYFFFIFLLGAKRSPLGAVWAFFIGFLLFFCAI